MTNVSEYYHTSAVAIFCGMLVAMFGFVSSIKATTERLTMAYLRRKKERRQIATAAATSAVALVGVSG